MLLKLLSRFERSNIVRKELNDIDSSGNVKVVRKRVADLINQSENDIELIYAGEKLKDDVALTSYGIKDGVVVHVMKRCHKTESDKSEKLSRGEIRDVVRTLPGGLLNPAYRNTVEKLLAKPETLTNMIEKTPELNSDPVALAILQSPDLLGILVDPSHVDKVLEKHPALAKAAMYISNALKEEMSKSAGSQQRSSGAGHYSLDRMSDDEDMDTSQGGATAQPITANLLASALAVAAARGAPPAQSTSSAGGSGMSQAEMTRSGNAITADFFASALQQAMGGAAAANTASSAPNPGDSTAQPAQQPTLSAAEMENQLQQLREMGITDENVARQALVAAGGDIQGALEIIYGEDL